MGENGGLTIERHYVTTKDGYILGLYRIVGPKNRDLDDGKPSRPMLFMHGMLSSSRDWVLYRNVSAGKYETNDLFLILCQTNDLFLSLNDVSSAI